MWTAPNFCLITNWYQFVFSSMGARTYFFALCSYFTDIFPRPIRKPLFSSLFLCLQDSITPLSPTPPLLPLPLFSGIMASLSQEWIEFVPYSANNRRQSTDLRGNKSRSPRPFWGLDASPRTWIADEAEGADEEQACAKEALGVIY